MKTINQYIQEKLFVKSNQNEYNYSPKTKMGLQTIISKRIKKEGNKQMITCLEINQWRSPTQSQARQVRSRRLR